MKGRNRVPCHLEIYAQKYLLKYSILGNWVMKWLLYLCLILLWFRYLDGLPKTYFRKVEFNCKVQLSTSDLFWCPKCTSCPYVCVWVYTSFYNHTCVSLVTIQPQRHVGCNPKPTPVDMGSYQQQASSSCGSPMQSLCIKFMGIFCNSQSNMFRLWIYICQ